MENISNETKEILLEILNKLKSTGYADTGAVANASGLGHSVIALTSVVRMKDIDALFAKYGVKKGIDGALCIVRTQE